MAELLHGRYEPLKVVGRGGQGEVARAVDRVHGRQVALKLRTAGTAAEREALLGEARVLLKLRPHSGLPLVREDFFVDDRYVMVMDWIEGTSLASLLAREGAPGLPVPVVLGWLRQVAVALDHLHGHRPPIVHGDVKPANVILTPEGRVVLVDFGISSPSRTRARPMGTPGYAAPELVTGGPFSPAADVFGLAATAVTLVTGVPFDGTRPAWEGLTPAEAAALERGLGPALAVDPSRRPRSAGALVAGLLARLEAALPGGIVTLLVADVEDAAARWDQAPQVMEQVVARYLRLVADAVEGHGGHLVGGGSAGERVTAAFTRPSSAARAALALQRAVQAEPWRGPIRPRVAVALHTGEAAVREGSYYGVAMTDCASLHSIASGGQTLMSQVTADLIQDHLPDSAYLNALGVHRIEGRRWPDHVWQLCHPDLPDDFPPLRSIAARTHDLLAPLTSFFGRERELGQVRQLLKTARLVTLTGTAGVGKTRLALQVATSVVDGYRDGVWLVELAPLSDEALVARQVASALGLRDQPWRAPTDTIADHLHSKQLLLVLDNCEHLITGAAQFAQAVLTTCPDLRILATSRQSLGVPGEQAWIVPSLSLPNAVEALTLEEAARCDVVRLFVDRASLADPEFQLTSENLGAVLEILRRLDGIPLAIELAAARVKVLSAAQIAARLDDRFRLLTGGSRTLLPRQRTLRALVDWSHDLLSEQEQALLRRLSVFAGGFSLEAAADICAGGPVQRDCVLDLVAQLVDKSLVLAQPNENRTRYGMLETIRQYHAERLTKSGEQEQFQRRYRRWYIELGERAESELFGPDQTAWLDTLEAEHDNLREALKGCREAGEFEAVYRLAAAVWRFWWIRGYLGEGRAWLDGAFSDHGLDSVVRAKALHAAGALAWDQSDFRTARDFLTEAMSLFAEQGDARGAAFSRLKLGGVFCLQGDYDRAEALMRESLALGRQTNDSQTTAYALIQLAENAMLQARVLEARSLSDESLAIFRELGDTYGITASLGTLGEAALHEGDRGRAKAMLEESLRMGRAMGDKWRIAMAQAMLGELAGAEKDYRRAAALHKNALGLRWEIGQGEGIAESIEALAALAADEGEGDLWRAAQLYGAADRVREAVGAPVHPGRRSDHEGQVALLRAGIDEAVFARAWEAGRALPLEDAIRFASEAGQGVG